MHGYGNDLYIGRCISFSENSIISPRLLSLHETYSVDRVNGRIILTIYLLNHKHKMLVNQRTSTKRKCGGRISAGGQLGNVHATYLILEVPSVRMVKHRVAIPIFLRL